MNVIISILRKYLSYLRLYYFIALFDPLHHKNRLRLKLASGFQAPL